MIGEMLPYSEYTFDEMAATLRVECADGEAQEFPMRNGMEFTTVFTSLSSSRIVPIAENATPFARYSYDKNFENFIINRLDIKLIGKRTVRRVTFTSCDKGYDILVYGVFA